MIEPRVYRAAFVPALLAAVVAMFSLESRPRPLPQGLPADVLFDGRLAAQAAASIVEDHPDRRAGTLGDRDTAALVAQALARRGFRVQRDRFRHAGEDLVNVIGRRAGRSRRQIVIAAARDASGVPDATGSAADTAALIELARVFRGRATRKTLVLASLDGSALGQAGAGELADELDRGLVDAVLLVSDLGAPERRGPRIVAWSNDSRRVGIGLERTVADSLRQELDEPVGGTRVAGQLARLSFPIGVGGQGVLLERGFEAVRISGSGELPPDGARSVERLDRDRLGGIGRAALRTATALDDAAAPPEHGPDTYVIAVSQVVPGWVISLLALALLVPAVVASVDAFARARRRREPVAPWLRWLAAGIGPLVAALALAEGLALVGATPDPPPAPVDPAQNPLDVAALVVLVGVIGTAAGLWLALRALARHGDPALADPSPPGAACATALALSTTVLVLWIVSPYAAFVLVPAAHLWMLATLVDPAPPRRARYLLVAAGLLPPLAVAVYYLVALSMDPLTGAWYLLLLVTGHTVGLATALIGCVLLAVLGSVLAIVRAGEDQREPVAPERPSIYGPGAYAGPGSLGGTESTLRR